MKLKSYLYITLLIGYNRFLIGQVTIGSSIKSPEAAILNIQTQADPNPSTGSITTNAGGVLLSRVSLTNINTLEPFVAGTPSNADMNTYKGMQVYHIGTNRINEGIYTWNGVKWYYSLSKIPSPPGKTNDRIGLAQKIEAKKLSSGAYDIINGGGVILPFGTKNPVTGDYEIRIPQNGDGQWAFSFKLVLDASVSEGTLVTRQCTYIYIRVNGNAVNGMEHQQRIIRQNNTTSWLYQVSYTINVILTATCASNDIITFRTGSASQSDIIAPYIRYGNTNVVSPAGSYLTYWKL